MKKHIPKLSWLVTAFVVVVLPIVIYESMVSRPNTYDLSENALNAAARNLFEDVSDLTEADLASATRVQMYDSERPYLTLPKIFSRWQRYVPLRKIFITDDDLKGLDQLPALKDLALVHTQVTDAGLVHLAKLTELKDLHLGGTQVTDAGLVHLAKLSELKDLHLGGTQVTDAGLVHLSKLTELQYLYLIQTQVTDAGLVHLAKLPELICINLEGTQVTDAGLVHLAKLPKLKYIDLEGIQVTDEAVERFNQNRKQAGLPECKFSR